MSTPQQHSLVLYKQRAATVKSGGDKLELGLQDGKRVKVRPKDVTLLHPGPITSLTELTGQQGEIETAWELLAGETTTLEELAELIYETYTPATAWATWQLVDEGLYFYGAPDEIVVRTDTDLAHEEATRKAKTAEKAAWADFLTRVERNRIEPEDEAFLDDVIRVARNQASSSRVMRALGQTANPENAHALLLRLGFWDNSYNPYPARFNLPIIGPTGTLPELPSEDRRDLTHLPAYAIDDEDSKDPDDALFLDGNRLWVHIADVGALIAPDSPADIEARARGANLYLPEGTIPMLPLETTRQLGLGLNEISPALSFGLDLGPNGTADRVEIVPSWVRVQRLTYEAVEARLDEEPFRALHQLAQQIQARRRANAAIELELPEAKVRVTAGQVSVRPLPPLQSRDLVRDAMLLCGEALARFAQHEDIPFPYSVQPPPDEQLPLQTLADMFAQRRLMKPSQRQNEPGLHAGLGLELYTQATSPLRRYADLVVHQQLRAYLDNRTLLTTQEVLARIGQAEAVGSSIRQVERLANKHWTLVYLKQNPNWSGQGILVERRGPRGLVLIPELDLEVTMNVPGSVTLNKPFQLTFNGMNLPLLDAYFRLGE